MSNTCPTGLDRDRLSKEVTRVYDRVARDPGGEFHFHRGLEFACSALRYDRTEIGSLPRYVVDRFAGVANPHRIASIEAGMTVLDIGSGGGTDLLLAARRVGPEGRAVGVDPTPAMRDIALRGARESGSGAWVEVRSGEALALPVEDSSVDVVISNGVLNLVPDKELAFREIHRVLKPGGRLQLGDVLLRSGLKPHERTNVDLWAGCVAGALLDSELLSVAAGAGLREGRITERFDPYRGTKVDSNVAASVGVHGANFIAWK